MTSAATTPAMESIGSSLANGFASRCNIPTAFATTTTRTNSGTRNTRPPSSVVFTNPNARRAPVWTTAVFHIRHR